MSRDQHGRTVYLTLTPDGLPPDACPLSGGSQVGHELGQLALVFRAADEAAD